MGVTVGVGVDVAVLVGVGVLVANKFLMPWGIIALLDVYFMFFLFSAWIYHRERNKIVFLLWFVALLLLGSFIAYLYTIQALITSRGLKPRFWHGEQSVSG